MSRVVHGSHGGRGASEQFNGDGVEGDWWSWVGGDDHWVDMPARMPNDAMQTTTTASLGRGCASQAVQVSGVSRARRRKHVHGEISHRRMALVGCPALVARTVGLDAMPVPEDYHKPLCNRPYSSRPYHTASALVHVGLAGVEI